MKNLTKTLFSISFAVICFGLFSLTAYATSVNISGWAWSSNIGWNSLSSTNPTAGAGGSHGLTLNSNGTLTGYMWGSNIGWIKFGGLGTSPLGGDSDAQVTTSGGSLGKVTGWARACSGTVNKDCNSASRTDGWDGWIELSGVNHVSPDFNGNGGVTYFSGSNSLSGYAWGSDVVGWIIFSPGTTGIVADIKADGSDTTISRPMGSQVAITWTSGGSATSCTITRNGVSWTSGLSATMYDNVMSNTTYVETCIGPNGISATDSVTVNVTLPLNVYIDGTGSGMVTSVPVGINCSTSLTSDSVPCSSYYDLDSYVTLTASSTMGNFAGWSGIDGEDCGTGNICKVLIKDIYNVGSTNVIATFNADNAPDAPIAGGKSTCGGTNFDEILSVKIDWLKPTDPDGLITGYNVYRDYDNVLGRLILVHTVNAGLDATGFSYVDNFTTEEQGRVAHSYVVSTLYSDGLGGTSEAMSDQFFVPGCGKTYFSMDAGNDVVIVKNEDTVGISSEASRLIKGIPGTGFYKLSLIDKVTGSTIIEDMECDPGIDLNAPGGSSVRNYLDFFSCKAQERTSVGHFRYPGILPEATTTLPIFIEGLDILPLGEYKVQVKTAMSDRIFMNGPDGDIKGYCNALYSPGYASFLSCAYNYVENLDGSINMFLTPFFGSMLPITNFGSSAVFNDNQFSLASLFVKIANAFLPGARNNNIQEPIWQSGVEAYANTMCNTANPGVNSGNWAGVIMAQNTETITCTDKTKAIPVEVAEFDINVVPPGINPVSIRANRPSCKVRGGGAAEIYITPQTSGPAVTEYKITWRKTGEADFIDYVDIDPAFDLVTQNNGELLYVARGLEPKINYDFKVRAKFADGTYSSYSNAELVLSSACDPEFISLQCSGLSAYTDIVKPNCVADFDGLVNLTPEGKYWGSCTPTSNPVHSGWNSGSYIVSALSDTTNDNSGYEDFATSGGYDAKNLNKKEYVFTWTCDKIKDSSLFVSDPPKEVNVCVKPPIVPIIGQAKDTSTIEVYWDKPAVHNSFSLRYVLTVDNATVISIANDGTTSDPNASCGLTKCTYNHTGLTSGSLHNYKLQVLADYDACDPANTMTLSTETQVTTIVPNCNIDLKVNGGYGPVVYNNVADAKPTMTWVTTNLPNNATCTSSGLPDFNGSLDCKSGVVHSKILDMTGSAPQTYNGSLNTTFGSCSRNTVQIIIGNIPPNDFILRADPGVIEIVAVGSAENKNIVSSPTTISLSPGTGFNEDVSLSATVVGVGVDSLSKKDFSKVSIDKNKTSVLTISSLDNSNPIPDGSYLVNIKGTSTSGKVREVNVSLKVRTVAPGYKEY